MGEGNPAAGGRGGESGIVPLGTGKVEGGDGTEALEFGTGGGRFGWGGEWGGWGKEWRGRLRRDGKSGREMRGILTERGRKRESELL